MTKTALQAEAIWNREQNSADQLDLVYREQTYLPESTYNPTVYQTTNSVTTPNQGDNQDMDVGTPGKQKKTTRDSLCPTDKPV